MITQITGWIWVCLVLLAFVFDEVIMRMPEPEEATRLLRPKTERNNAMEFTSSDGEPDVVYAGQAEQAEYEYFREHEEPYFTKGLHQCGGCGQEYQWSDWDIEERREHAREMPCGCGWELLDAEQEEGEDEDTFSVEEMWLICSHFIHLVELHPDEHRANQQMYEQFAQRLAKIVVAAPKDGSITLVVKERK